jgi:uncharacterized protein (DUF1684 family)
MTPFEELLDYRRYVSEMYSQVRSSTLSPQDTWTRFRQERDKLFCTHPQSALSDEQKANFTSLDYYDYDPTLRFALPVDGNVEQDIVELSLPGDGIVKMKRFGKVHLPLAEQNVSLSLFWILGYGGGVFLHFRDLTNHDETNGGGRYLLDTIKHADLGYEDANIVLDFNYAYNPSCGYNHRWYCPLFDHENELPVAIRAGEKMYADYQ